MLIIIRYRSINNRTAFLQIVHNMIVGTFARAPETEFQNPCTGVNQSEGALSLSGDVA